MHHRPGGLLRGSLQPRLSAPAPPGVSGGGCGSPARPGPLTPAPGRDPTPAPDGQPLFTPPSHRAHGEGGTGPPEGCCRALLLIYPYIWGRERRVGRHCCQWRLLTQIIIIKKNRYSWALTEYGNYYYCQSRLEIIILKARTVQLPRCFE